MPDDARPLVGLDPASLEALVEQIVGTAAERIYSASREGLSVARAWIGQDPKQVEKYGTEKASHYVYWYDPGGHQRCKSCGPGAQGKKLAGKLRRQVEAQLLTGTYEANCNKLWAEFRAEYEAKVLAGKARKTREQAVMSLSNFERIIGPKKVSAIKTETIDQFIAARRKEKKRYSETECVAPASVNADLRNLKAALWVAEEWGYLKDVPRFRMVREAKRLPVYVPADHFAALYLGCDQARLPAPDPASWWRAALVLMYVATGWRVGQVLALTREDLDLAAGTAIARGQVEGNKGKADRLVMLHPVAVEHLRKLPAVGPVVFPWPHDRRTLDDELHRLCAAAGVPDYGFHALRKGFGTMNAPRLSMTALQHLMQHASSQTTQRYYVNPLAEQSEAVGKLHVPEVLTRKTG